MKRSRLRSLFRMIFRDLGWKLLSLALAVLLWIFTVIEPMVTRFVNVPVQFRNLPENLEFSSDVIESVYLEVRGPASELQAVEGDRDYAVLLDMYHVRPGERTFTIRSSDVRLPRGTTLLRAIPSQLRFDFERRSTKTVPVRVRFGQPQPGYEVAGYQVSPPSLTIVGPEGRVRRINSVTTDLIDLSQVVGKSEFHVTAFVEDSYVRFAEPPQVVVQVQVRARADGAGAAAPVSRPRRPGRR